MGVWMKEEPFPMLWLHLQLQSYLQVHHLC